MAGPSPQDAAYAAYLAAIEQLERVAGELESAIDALALAGTQVEMVVSDTADDAWEHLDARAIDAIERVQRAPRGIDPAGGGLSGPPDVVNPNGPDIDLG